MEGRPGLGRRPGLPASPRHPTPTPRPSTRLHLAAAGSKGLSDPGPTLLSNLAPCRWPAACGGLSSSAGLLPPQSDPGHASQGQPYPPPTGFRLSLPDHLLEQALFFPYSFFPFLWDLVNLSG